MRLNFEQHKPEFNRSHHSIDLSFRIFQNVFMHSALHYSSDAESFDEIQHKRHVIKTKIVNDILR
jgi:hypothetical protein